MKPTDYRNATWADIESGLSGRRAQVYFELSRIGPCTTAELAACSELSILTVRPRVTELCQMGLARLANDKKGHEGTYEAVPLFLAEQAHRDRIQEAGTRQMEMRLQA